MIQGNVSTMTVTLICFVAYLNICDFNTRLTFIFNFALTCLILNTTSFYC